MSTLSEQDLEWAEFLDRLIHDLREPLRSVHAFAEILHESAGDRLGPECEPVLRELLSGTTRMRTLMDSVSGYSTALREAGGSTVGSKGASLQLAFDAVVNGLAGQIMEIGATVTSEGLPRVNASLERAMQLMENLISNSLKFRADAPPLIRVSAQREGEGWDIQIEDNGIGIDTADSETIFKPFTRIYGRKYPGAGLGLCICRKIVEAHGGKIRMAPRAGGGAVCTFWLPAA